MWLQVDPLSEKYAAFNPYNYTLDNPMKFVDPRGMLPMKYTINGVEMDYDTWNMFAESFLPDGGKKEKNKNQRFESNKETAKKKGQEKKQEGLSPSEKAEIVAGALGVSSNTVNSVLEIGNYFANTSKEITDLLKIEGAVSKFGKLTGVTALGISISNAYDEPSTENILKVGTNAGLFFVKNPYVLGIMGILDVTGVSDSFYHDTAKLINTFSPSNLKRMYFYLRNGGFKKW